MLASGESFRYHRGSLSCELCSVKDIAESVPTPFYVYSSSCIRERYRALDRAFATVEHLICYALKANSQPELLRLLVEASQS